MAKQFDVLPVDRRRIKKAREARGWGHTELAEQAGIADRTQLWRIESGETKRSEHLPAIYRALGLPRERMNHEDPDIDALLSAYEALRDTRPRLAKRLLQQLIDKAKKAAEVDARKKALEAEEVGLDNLVELRDGAGEPEAPPDPSTPSKPQHGGR